jgi:hypothetical protein
MCLGHSYFQFNCSDQRTLLKAPPNEFGRFFIFFINLCNSWHKPFNVVATGPAHAIADGVVWHGFKVVSQAQSMAQVDQPGGVIEAVIS